MSTLKSDKLKPYISDVNIAYNFSIKHKMKQFKWKGASNQTYFHQSEYSPGVHTRKYSFLFLKT